jgi:thiamine biosynthesis protein ThiI
MSKAIALVSGGIDSAVAAALALEQGMQPVFLHFDTVPLGNTKGREKTILLARHLAQLFGKKIKVIIAPHGSVLFAIAKNCDRKYGCVLCRRMMLRIAEKIAAKEKAGALLTGESLGQVASQTLANLNAEHSAVSIPIIRPLLSLDKLQIEKLAKKFGTFETSILPSACCSIPSKPATKSNKAVIEEEEKKLDIEKLALDAAKKAKTEEIGFK